ncbi:hypothetical protein H6G04_02770 [Calothrix membranacea FACHB-236]|nr:hypothetical protein [Calothrix membranacea FACHB-236]
MFKPPTCNLNTQISEIPVSDRWRIYQHLQDLMIPCRSPADHSVMVGFNHAIAALFVRSHAHNSFADRQELLDWLEKSCTAEVNY